jgi:hypothetical protein
LEFIKLKKYLQAALTLSILALMWGCGSGEGATPIEVTNNGASVTTSNNSASVTIIPSGGGEFVVQGDNMDGVAGISLTITYDRSTMSSPTVTQGGFISGALMISNTVEPGTIRIAIISTKEFSGNGQIATISFAAALESGNVSITSINMINSKGTPIP